MKIFIVSLKKIILPILICLFIICLIIFSKQNLEATKKGLLLFTNSIVPTLLPFFIATELLSKTNVVFILGKLLNKIMRPLFNVPGIGAFPLIMGIISGYPTGAKIVSNYKKNNLCSRSECERLLAFTNNSGPLFILGAVGISIFKDSRIGFLLLITHIISCLIVGIIFRFWKKDAIPSTAKTSSQTFNSNLSFSNLGEVLANSITSSVNTLIIIGGFIVIFSVILSIFENSNILNPLYNLCINFGLSNSNATSLINGLFEITNGLNKISIISNNNLSTSLVITSFLLGFGGLSVFLQVLSIVSKENLSIKPYFYGKLLHGTIAAILTYILTNYFNFFKVDIIPTFSRKYK